MKIAYVTADAGYAGPGLVPIPGGAGWVRVHQPARYLAHQGGHDVAIGVAVGATKGGWLIPLNQDHKPLMAQPDLVIIQRWMFREAADLIRVARASGQVVIQDIDDWFWGLDPANRAFHATDPKNNPDNNRDHYAAAVTASDAVTVSTPFLAKRIRERFGTRTILIRNAVDRVMFATQPVRDTTEGLVIGWTGALAWRSGDLETMREVLPGWLSEARATFVHHGVFPRETETAAHRIGLTPELTGPSRSIKVPWEYPENLTGFDIGIVPLAKVDFNTSKSWIKGLEYAAAGIPFVAQRTPEYEALGCGLTADTPREWAAALDELTDPVAREDHQRRGLQVARDHDLATRWTDWEDTYRELLT